MPLLTSSEAADIIEARTGFRPDRRWLHAQAITNLLPDHGTGVHHRFDADELAEFLARYPYRRTLPFAYLGVSLGVLVEVDEYERTAPAKPFRRWAGYDHHNTRGLTSVERARAIVANWRISRATAQYVLDHRLPLIGDVKGVVDHDMIYWPRGIIPLAGGIGFDIDPDLRGHDEIGTGAIIDIPRGNVWRLMTEGTAP
ncbi:hypothetical protein ACFWPH_28700 [Nocardia sp. NPDC058499]|uniref:hypothetical protein n=1 Tax=Nocardia sp. NPDC058499 TaxID=3346530 RepID=UPI003651A0E5